MMVVRSMMALPMDEAWNRIQNIQGEPLGGSTGAVKRGDFVVKPGASAGHVANEYDMNQYLNALGVGVPEASLQTQGGRTHLMTRFEEGAKEPNLYDPAVKRQLQQDFVPHAAIANWDMLGLDADNVLIRPDGTPTYVDLGGAGPYRSMGAPKGGAWGGDVGELETMRYKPPHTEQVFGEMDEADIGRSYDHYGGQDAMEQALQYLRNKQTRNVMQQRIEDIARQVA